MPGNLDRLFPVAIVTDRYHGTYSGGLWWAVALADAPFDEIELEPTRLAHCLDDGPNGTDHEALAFWAKRPRWIAVGNTPTEAMEALLAHG